MFPVTERVPVAVIFDPVIFPVANIFPTTDSLSNGEVVERPSDPVGDKTSRFTEDELSALNIEVFIVIV